MKWNEYINENTLIKILDIGVSPYSDCTLYICTTNASKKKFEKEFEYVPNKLVFTKREIYSNKVLIGKIYRNYRFV